jgi:hypothetical protein
MFSTRVETDDRIAVGRRLSGWRGGQAEGARDLILAMSDQQAGRAHRKEFTAMAMR